MGCRKLHGSPVGFGQVFQMVKEASKIPVFNGAHKLLAKFRNLRCGLGSNHAVNPLEKEPNSQNPFP